MRRIRRIVDDLKLVFQPKQQPFGKMYDSIKEMDRITSPLALGETEEEWEESFIERLGTKEAFIMERTQRKLDGKD
jgi:hypothetical protein